MVKNSPLYQQIYDDLLNSIRMGEYSVGEKLPTEKELSAQYNVSRITSKKALDRLADSGLVVRMPGKGSFVSDDEISNANEEAFINGKSKVIGLIMDGFGASFGYKLVLGIDSECKKHNFSLALRCTYGSVKSENQAIDEMIALGVSGIIIMCVHQENYNSKVLKLIVNGFPIVVIDRRLRNIPVNFIGTDNENAAIELTNHLFDQGFKNICFVAPHSIDTPSINERYNGFIKSCRAHGNQTPESIISMRSTLPESRTESNLELDQQLLLEYIESHPKVDAYFAVEYDLAKITKKLLKDLGKDNCPVVCFDGIDNAVDEVEFTHVRQREQEIGEEAVLRILELLKGNLTTQTTLVPYDIRFSTNQR